MIYISDCTYFDTPQNYIYLHLFLTDHSIDHTGSQRILTMNKNAKQMESGNRLI